MKFKLFVALMLVLLAVVCVISCGEEETTTAEPEVTTAATTTEATTTAATTTAATTTAATTTAATTTKATTTKATTKATTTAATTTAATTTAATTTAATTTAAPVASSPYDKVPTLTPDGEEFDSLVIFNGNKESYSMSCNDKNSRVDITTLPDGNKVFAYHLAADYKYGALGELDYEFNGREDGLLFYMDASDTGEDTHPRYGVNLRIGSQWYQLGTKSNDISNAPDAVHSYMYYMVDGTDEWVKTENYDNNRCVLTNQFKGWIYVPFDQINYKKDATAPDEEPITTNGNVIKFFRMYTGKNLVREGDDLADIYFDNIIVVTSKVRWTWDDFENMFDINLFD